VKERLKRDASKNICGAGPGACCAGSNDGCPPEAPICSEYGYCQCSSYQPGGPACGPGFDDAPPIDNEANGGQVCGMGQGACCAGSNDGCPPEAPICSEYGYCQCASYQPGGPACGPSFDDVTGGQGQEGGQTNGAEGDVDGMQINERQGYVQDEAAIDDNQIYEEYDQEETYDYDTGAEGEVCGTGLGACCAGSNDGCPPEAPVCSEYGYCQCSSYQPGGPECGPGFAEEGGQENQGICGVGQGSCCAGSNDGCPPEAPICSEYGYCQCSSYQPGGSACGAGFP